MILPRKRTLVVALGFVLVLGAFLMTGSSQRSLVPPLTAPSLPSNGFVGTSCQAVPTPGTVRTVTAFGALGDGVTDDGPAIRRALATAATDRGTVYFPPGQYAVASGGPLRVPSAMTLRGAGRDSTAIVQHQDGQLFSIQADGSAITEMTVDTQTVNGSVAIGTRANHVTVSKARVLGGPRAFAVFFAGPLGATAAAPSYNTCNRVVETDINDQITDDGFSWSFQKDSEIRNVTQVGSRLALYRVVNTLVDGYRYAPGTQQTARDGFWITPPSSNVTIRNFKSTGAGGVIGVSDNGYKSTSIAIVGETAAKALKIGDVDGLSIDSSSVALAYDPLAVATHVVISPNSQVQPLPMSPAAGDGRLPSPARR